MRITCYNVCKNAQTVTRESLIKNTHKDQIKEGFKLSTKGDSLFCFFSRVTMIIDKELLTATSAGPVAWLLGDCAQCGRNTCTDRKAVFSEHLTSLRVGRSVFSDVCSKRGPASQYSTCKSTDSEDTESGVVGMVVMLWLQHELAY